MNENWKELIEAVIKHCGTIRGAASALDVSERSVMRWRDGDREPERLRDQEAIKRIAEHGFHKAGFEIKCRACGNTLKIP